MPVHTNSTASIEKSELYPTPDPLFLERLEAFCQQSLQDVRAFAERESMPFEDVSDRPVLGQRVIFTPAHRHEDTSHNGMPVICFYGIQPSES